MLNPDFSDMLSAFTAENVEYLLDALIRNKRALARPKDLADVAALEQQRP